jgi:myo-inositol 2-dehydrogenase / D-chiro-inositol 1-dehydrogenase
MKESDFSRRDFLGAAAVAAGAGLILSGCGKSETKVSFVDVAPDGPPLKAGLIGCGGRGTGAAQNFLKAGPNLSIVALADVFDDQLQKARGTLERKNKQKIEDSRCYVGFDAYKKLIESDVDIVLLATPPHFRPAHFEAAVEAKKNIFMEKPVAVDPVGIRSILASAEKAKAYNLSVVTGTQRRHQRQYVSTQAQVAAGRIGKIVGARCSWAQGQLWFKPKQEGWSDMEGMLRDWVNWSWLSGDHIVEQHVHNIDVIHWFAGAFPVKAVGYGGRMRRVTGDQYDFFSVEFTFSAGQDKDGKEREGGFHNASYCRQIDGCKNDISEYIWGTEGFTNCKDTIFDKEGNIVWQYVEDSKSEPGKKSDPGYSAVNPYDQEHVDLVTAIRTNKPLNEAEATAKSTLAAIMGRMSAYTGKEVTLEQVMTSDLKLGPKEYVLGPVADIKPEVPVPGTSKAAKPAAED